MILDHVGIEGTRFCSEISHTRPDRVAQLAEHWASIPKVIGSIPTVDRHIFQACSVWYTLRVTSQASYSPEYIASTQKISFAIKLTCILLCM